MKGRRKLRMFLWFFAPLVWNPCGALAAEPVDGLSPLLTDAGVVWGKQTNGFRAGVLVWRNAQARPPARMVSVYVLNSVTNRTWNYVSPPGPGFAALHLQDSSGTALSTLRKGWNEGELPRVIATKDLPRTVKGGKSMGGDVRDYLMLAPGMPVMLGEFPLQGIFEIRKQGDYTLTIKPSIYEFSTNRQSVFRLDLPDVTVMLKLGPD